MERPVITEGQELTQRIGREWAKIPGKWSPEQGLDPREEDMLFINGWGYLANIPLISAK